MPLSSNTADTLSSSMVAILHNSSMVATLLKVAIPFFPVPRQPQNLQMMLPNLPANAGREQTALQNYVVVEHALF